ncbi:MAG TPA: hypothetical protein VGO45_11540, partial [Bacteroidia bacterium]|nr:hypothetical protein [Bacteroidia bacterium]
NRFALVPKLGLGYEGGSDQDSLARVLLPYIGINLAFGKPKFHVYIGVSGIIPVKMGQGKNRAQDPYLSFSINPRIRISSHDNLLVGLKYNYFVNGPPNSTGQSWGGITFNYYWPEIINQEYK